jgi:hypothetical protein
MIGFYENILVLYVMYMMYDERKACCVYEPFKQLCVINREFLFSFFSAAAADRNNNS